RVHVCVSALEFRQVRVRQGHRVRDVRESTWQNRLGPAALRGHVLALVARGPPTRAPGGGEGRGMLERRALYAAAFVRAVTTSLVGVLLGEIGRASCRERV